MIYQVLLLLFWSLAWKIKVSMDDGTISSLLMGRKTRFHVYGIVAQATTRDHVATPFSSFSMVFFYSGVSGSSVGVGG